MTVNPHHRSDKSRGTPVRKGLHPKNLHNQGYDFPALVKSHPALAPYVKPNAYGDLTIDFSDPLAVKTLNAELLKRYYNIVDWDIPEGALCPPIPGRADYIHCMADLVGLGHEQRSIKLLDIGTGANGIYPLLACQIYGWQCVGRTLTLSRLRTSPRLSPTTPRSKIASRYAGSTIKTIFLKGSFNLGSSLTSAYATHPFTPRSMKHLKVTSVNSITLREIAVSKKHKPNHLR